MNLREAIKAQTIEHFKLPKGAEVSKELMAKYMLVTKAADFADKIVHVHLCNSCSVDVSDCEDARNVELNNCGSCIVKCDKYKSWQ